jgi:hypothetical protein
MNDRTCPIRQGERLAAGKRAHRPLAAHLTIRPDRQHQLRPAGVRRDQRPTPIRARPGHCHCRVRPRPLADPVGPAPTLDPRNIDHRRALARHDLDHERAGSIGHGAL